MNRAYIVDRNGNPRPLDDSEPNMAKQLKDGERLVTPVTLRDSDSVRRVIIDGYSMTLDADDAAVVEKAFRKMEGRIHELREDAASATRFTDAWGERAGRKSGYVFDAANAGAKAKLDAYCDAETRLTNAWKRDSVPSYAAYKEGSECSRNGAPGHIRGGECVPDDPEEDHADGQSVKDAAYTAMCQQLQDAYKR